MPKKDDTSGGKAPVMAHGSGLSDAANFLKYMKKLGTYLIRERGPASYLLKKPDFDDGDEMWGLSADPHHPSKTNTKYSASVKDYWQSQALLLDTLTHAFARDEELLEDFQAEGLKEKYMKEHNLSLEDSKLQWLPFGSLALHALATRYKDSPGNSMLHLCHEYEKKLGNCDSNNLGAFARDMESAGGKYLAAIKTLSPEHMLVLQMLTALRRTTNTECVAFVQHFTAKNENKLYNLPDFLTSLRTFIQNLAAQNVGNAKGAGATVNAITRAVNKTCAVKNCTTPLKEAFHQYCPRHFQALKTADQPNLPAQVVDSMKDKMTTQRKKRFARKKKQTQSHDAATAIREPQANSVEADVTAASTSASPNTASASKKRKASDVAVSSSVSTSSKKSKLASQIAKTGKAAILKKKTKATTSAKKVNAKAQSVRKATKAARREAHAVIAQFGSNETMMTSRFADRNPFGLLSPEASYALCETGKARQIL